MASEHQDQGVSSSDFAAENVKGVGILLREERERQGQDLPAVAVQLRIRLPYLQAIEAQRYYDLPGSTYAVGFVRGYAEHLGLDSEDIVRRFKQEMGGEFGSRKELVFPTAVNESSIPTGGLLFLALILAGLAYGGWYWYEGHSEQSADAVPALPDRLAALIHRPVGGSGSEVIPVAPAGGVQTAAVPSSDGTNANAPLPPSVPVTPSAAPSDSAAAPAVSPPAADPASAAVTVQPPLPPSTAPVASDADPAKPVVEPTKVEQVKLSDTKSVKDLKKLEAKPVPSVAAKPAEPSEPEEAMPADLSPPAPEPAKPVEQAKPVDQPKPADPQAKPDDGKPSRVVLKAEEDCWIEVRDASGAIVHSRLLRRGETYSVPSRSGLSLTAGNAGALSVLVDGKGTTSLGRAGMVRRGVTLDADRLNAGAGAPPPPPAPPADAPADGAAPAAAPTGAVQQ